MIDLIILIQPFFTAKPIIKFFAELSYKKATEVLRARSPESLSADSEIPNASKSAGKVKF